jgi:hypothetical protein
MLLTALLLRLAFVFLGFPWLEGRWHLHEDGDGYGAIAQSIRDGHYSDVTRGPVYPVFVAAAGSPVAVKVAQAILDSAICLLVYWLARSTFPAARSTLSAPLLAAWLWAIYPFAIWRVAFLNKEVVLAFLLAGYVCLQLIALRNGKIWPWLAAGGMLGLINLCKPMFLPWPIVIALFAVWNRVPLARVALLVAVMLGSIAPWTIRNWRVTGGEFLPVATERGGVTTFVGNYQPTLGLWEGPGDLKARWMAAVALIELRHAGSSAVQMDRVFYRAAWQQMISHPAKAFEMSVRKCGRFWFLSAARRERTISFIIQLSWLSLACIGLWRLRPWSAQTRLLVTLILYVMLIHAISYADLRFCLPLMPFVCVLGATVFQRTDRKTDATNSAAMPMP